MEDFKLNIGTLTNTIDEYINLFNILNQQKEIINNSISQLISDGWSGAARDKFEEEHEKNQRLYEDLVEDIKYMIEALDSEEKPKALMLKNRCEDFENCITRRGSGNISTGNDTGLITLDYASLFPIKNYIDTCTNDYYKTMQSSFSEILDITSELKYTSFNIGGDIFSCQSSIRNQTTSLKDFDESFSRYYQGVKQMESDICSILGKISGITEGISSLAGDSIIYENGEINVDRLKELLRKDSDELSDSELQQLTYIINIMDKDEYDNLKKSIDDESIGENADFITSYLEKVLPQKIANGEKIVISGNYDDDADADYAARNFIETAIKQIKDWQLQDNKDITWIVTTSGYSEKDIEGIKEVAEEKHVNLMFIDNADTIIDYMNTGKDSNGNVIENRVISKVSDISIFSHGLRDDGGTLSLDYHSNAELRNADLNIINKELQDYNINKNCFSDTYTYFASCNAGTVQNGRSFASEWVAKVGGEAQAICDPTPEDNQGGQTYYGEINKGKGIIWRGVDAIKRRFGFNFDKEGCSNYPILGISDFNHDIYWTDIFEDRETKKISNGGPRK